MGMTGDDLHDGVVVVWVILASPFRPIPLTPGGERGIPPVHSWVPSFAGLTGIG